MNHFKNTCWIRNWPPLESGGKEARFCRYSHIFPNRHLILCKQIAFLIHKSYHVSFTFSHQTHPYILLGRTQPSLLLECSRFNNNSYTTDERAVLDFCWHCWPRPRFFCCFPAAFLLLSCFLSRRTKVRYFNLSPSSKRNFSLICAHPFAHFFPFFGTFLPSFFLISRDSYLALRGD